MKAPFPWFGGKSRAAAAIWQRFGNTPNYVEPFAGSLAVLLQRPHEGKTESVNDIDCYLSNFWRALQAEPEAVAQWADWPVNECVPAGTMISTPDGDVPVEDIRPGMVVWGERDGRLTKTTVIATKQSETTDPLIRIEDLLLTGNHPVWTSTGYIDARWVEDGMTIGLLPPLPVDESELIMLQYEHESTSLGNLHSIRSEKYGSALCGRDLSPQTALQRAYIESDRGRQNTPRLLDSLIDFGWNSPTLSSYPEWNWRGLARSRAALDSVLSHYWRKQERSSICSTTKHPLQGIYPQTPVVVYNFQTTSSNYFANRILVHNCDLHSRHLWLIGRSEFRERMKADPDFYDCKIAGWWVWGICQWIGRGWCHSDYYTDTTIPASPSRQLPHMSGAGMGIHRPSQKLPHMGNAGMGDDLHSYMYSLSDRLRRVRVACGDWTRVLGDSVTFRHGVTGILLDPPYSHDERQDDLYANDNDVADDVRQWAIANGDNHLMRIALCGYADEHDMPMFAEVA